MLENSYPKEVVHEELILYCIGSSSSESVELIGMHRSCEQDNILKYKLLR